METRLVGSRTSFAIEFSDLFLQGEATFGQGGLWISGYQLHEAGTPVCLDTVLAGLQGIVNAPPATDSPSLPLRSAEELLLTLQGQDEADIHQHHFLPIETFDDFIKLFIKDSEYTTFVWALHPEVAGLAVYGTYPKGVQTALVKNSELRSIVQEFARSVESSKG